MVIPFKYDRVYSYYIDKDNTKIKVKISDVCFYINRKGEEIRKKIMDDVVESSEKQRRLNAVIEESLYKKIKKFHELPIW